MAALRTVCASQWTWARPLPEAWTWRRPGRCSAAGITVFAPLLRTTDLPTARVGIIGIGGLGHMALQFANKWGCEVHAFTTSDSKEAEARKLGAHHVHNTKRDGELKKIAGKSRPDHLHHQCPAGCPRIARHLSAQGPSPYRRRGPRAAWKFPPSA